jgi:hypothetical protein
MVLRARIPVAVVVLAAVLTGCVPTSPVEPGADPQGPVPPATGPITLERLATVVSAEDAPRSATFDVGEASTSGADLASEQDYWVAVGGSPEQCADIVSSPYLVSAADVDDERRLDDPSGTLGTFTEAEDLFGLSQVYGRVFDDEASASGFLDALGQVVAGCPGYQLTGADGQPNYVASALTFEESATAPAGTRVVMYGETVTGSEILSVRTTFIQHETAVVAVYAELYPSSTMTGADVAKISDAVATRMAAL